MMSIIEVEMCIIYVDIDLDRRTLSRCPTTSWPVSLLRGLSSTKMVLILLIPSLTWGGDMFKMYFMKAQHPSDNRNRRSMFGIAASAMNLRNWMTWVAHCLAFSCSFLLGFTPSAWALNSFTILTHEARKTSCQSTFVQPSYLSLGSFTWEGFCW